MEYYYAWFFLFAICAYFITTDESVAKGFYYITKILKFQYEKSKWWLIHNPSNPIIKYLIWRRAMKLAKEIQKDLQK